MMFCNILVSEGFSTIEEIIETDKSELLSIEGFDEDIVNELVDRSNKFLSDKEIENNKKLTDMNVSQDLMEF